MRLMRAAAILLAIGVVLLTGAGVLYARSLGPNVRAGTFSPIAVAPGPAVARVLPSPVSPATNPDAVPKPVTEPVTQGPPRSCAPLVVTSFSATPAGTRQFTAHWSATGGCAWYQASVSWYGSPVISGQVDSNVPISGAETVTVSAPCSLQASYANLQVLFLMGDSRGNWAQTTGAGVQVKLC